MATATEELLSSTISPPETGGKKKKSPDEALRASAVANLATTMKIAQDTMLKGVESSKDFADLKQAETDALNASARLKEKHMLTNLDQITAINIERMNNTNAYLEGKKEDAAELDATQDDLLEVYNDQREFSNSGIGKLLTAIVPRTVKAGFNSKISPLLNKINLLQNEQIHDAKSFLDTEDALVKKAKLTFEVNKQQMKENAAMNTLLSIASNNVKGRKAQIEQLVKTAGLVGEAAASANKVINAIDRKADKYALKVQQAIQTKQMVVAQQKAELDLKQWEKNEAAYDSANEVFKKNVPSKFAKSLREWNLKVKNGLATHEEVSYVSAVHKSGEAVGENILNTPEPFTTYSVILAEDPERITPEMQQFMMNIDTIKDNAGAYLAQNANYASVTPEDRLAMQNARVKDLQRQANEDAGWLVESGNISLESLSTLVAGDRKRVAEGYPSVLNLPADVEEAFSTFTTKRTDLEGYMEDMVRQMADSKLSIDKLSIGIASIFDLYRDSFNGKGMFKLEILRSGGKNLNNPAVWEAMVQQHKSTWMYSLYKSTQEPNALQLLLGPHKVTLPPK